MASRVSCHHARLKRLCCCSCDIEVRRLPHGQASGAGYALGGGQRRVAAHRPAPVQVDAEFQMPASKGDANVAPVEKVGFCGMLQNDRDYDWRDVAIKVTGGCAVVCCAHLRLVFRASRLAGFVTARQVRQNCCNPALCQVWAGVTRLCSEVTHGAVQATPGESDGHCRLAKPSMAPMIALLLKHRCHWEEQTTAACSTAGLHGAKHAYMPLLHAVLCITTVMCELRHWPLQVADLHDNEALACF